MEPRVEIGDSKLLCLQGGREELCSLLRSGRRPEQRLIDYLGLRNTARRERDDRAPRLSRFVHVAVHGPEALEIRPEEIRPRESALDRLAPAERRAAEGHL